MYPSISVMDTRTGTLITWTAGAVAAGREADGLALAREARRLADAGEMVNFYEWDAPHKATLAEDADLVDVLATLCAATGGNYSILEAPQGLAEQLIRPTTPDPETFDTGDGEITVNLGGEE